MHLAQTLLKDIDVYSSTLLVIVHSDHFRSSTDVQYVKNTIIHLVLKCYSSFCV